MKENRVEPGLSAERDYRMDNIRFLLIYLMILGHLLETIHGGREFWLYKVIYSFHMPALMFVSGRFSRFSVRRLFRRLIFPYLVFQILYRCFDSLVFHSQCVISFSTPYWILWYLVTLITYNLVLPLFQTEDRRKMILVICAGVLITLLAGFDDDIGNLYSMSRTLYFFPFFIAGYYSKTLARDERIRGLIQGSKKRNAAAALFAALVCEWFIISDNIPYGALYGARSYFDSDINLPRRLVVMICAFSWLVFLYYVVPNRKLRMISSLGRDTFSIYILHGFIVKLIERTHILNKCGEGVYSVLLAMLIALALYCMLSLNFTKKPFRSVFYDRQ